MKRIVFLLVMAFGVASSLSSAPEELRFLESLLPASKHLRTSTVPSHPSGIIFVEYIGEDSIGTVAEHLGKALDARLEKTTLDAEKIRFLDAWSKTIGVEPKTRDHVSGGGVSVFIVTYFSGVDSEGPAKRHIALQITRG